MSALLSFPCGGVGMFECSLRHTTSRSATIHGTEGVITVPFPFWCPTQFQVQRMTGLGNEVAIAACVLPDTVLLGRACWLAAYII